MLGALANIGKAILPSVLGVGKQVLGQVGSSLLGSVASNIGNMLAGESQAQQTYANVNRETPETIANVDKSVPITMGDLKQLMLKIKNDMINEGKYALQGMVQQAKDKIIEESENMKNNIQDKFQMDQEYVPYKKRKRNYEYQE